MLKAYDKWRKRYNIEDTRAARYTYKAIKQDQARDIIILLLVGLAIISLIVVLILSMKVEKTYTTPAGDYTCRGTVVKVCTGDKEVMDFLGV